MFNTDLSALCQLWILDYSSVFDVDLVLLYHFYGSHWFCILILALYVRLVLSFSLIYNCCASSVFNIDLVLYYTSCECSTSSLFDVDLVLLYHLYV